MNFICRTLIFAICLVELGVFQVMAQASVGYEACLKERLMSAPDSMTVGELRDACEEKLHPAAASQAADGIPVDAVEKRLKAEEANILRPFTIMAHKQNYLLVGAHNFKGYGPEANIEAEREDAPNLDRTESQFQISIKTPLAVHLFGTDVDMMAAYTLRSFWQVYNTSFSSPFRETDHEPELWLQAYPDFELFGFTNAAAAFGIVHQSNGQAQNLSRSWNRVFAHLVFHKGNLAISMKPWLRIEEDSEEDDNPDITDFLGHGELRAVYKYGNNTFTAMSRNNLESGFSRGAVELGWSFPLLNYPYLKGYIQYFSGYGESLIDYDRYVNKIGIGILLTDFL